MAKRSLSAKEVDAISKTGVHSVAPGLYLQVRDHGTRSWLFRYGRDGKNYWLGLGAAADVPLSAARAEVERLRVAVRAGAHPVAEKRTARETEIVEQKKVDVPTFDWCCREYIGTHEKAWKNSKHYAQWVSTLKTYASPVMGKLPVDQIDINHVLKVLQPIWTKMPETASRLRGRIEKVLGWAAAKSFRSADNPARLKGAPLEHLLPSLGRIQKIEPRKAVPYTEVPVLVDQLMELGSTSALALIFTILTGARTGETIGARWKEFDLTDGIWTIPGERMKANRVHRVALAAPVVEMLRARLSEETKSDDFVFRGKRGALSNMAMLEVMRGIRDDGCTVHGFRSSFSTWAAERTDHPREVVEAALAHATGDAVELAYKRTDYLQKRSALMEDWAAFCLGVGAALVEWQSIVARR